MRCQVVADKQEAEDTKEVYEKRFKLQVAEIDELKSEVLKAKRQINSSEEKFQTATKEMQAMQGHSQAVANKLHAVQVSHNAYDVGLSGFFTGFGSSQASIAPPPRTETPRSVISSGAGNNEFSTDLEVLYIQREKELLAKLADAMTQVKMAREDERSEKRRRVAPKSIVVEGGGGGQNISSQHQNKFSVSPPNVPLSPKRGSGKPGLHQPTASSRAKNLQQIEKKKRMLVMGKSTGMLKKGAGIGGGKRGRGVIGPDEGMREKEKERAREATQPYRYEANLTPLPFDKQLRRGREEEEISFKRPEEFFRGEEGEGGKAVARLTTADMNSFHGGVQQTPFSTMSDWSTSVREAKTPLDALKERLWG